MKRAVAWSILAAVPAAHAADVTVNLPIDAVTVYRDSAIVRRAGTVELPAGESRLIVRDLPDGLAPATVRLTAKSANARLGGIEIQRITKDDLVNETERTLNRRARDLDDQKAIVLDDIEAAENQLKLLGAVAQAPSGSGEKSALADGSTLNGLVTAVGSQEAGARARIRAARLRLRELDEQLAVVKADLQKVGTSRKATTELRATLRVDGSGAVPVELEYQMSEAGWSWQYEARLDTQTRKVLLLRQAELRQGTGEDWKNVELVVSTSRPTMNAATPRLAALFLELRDPREYAAGSGDLQEVVVTGARARSPRRYVPRSAGVLAQADKSAAPAPPPRESADVYATDFVADYRIPGRVNVAADRQSRVYPIGDDALDVELVARANLAAARNAFLEAKVRYRGEVPVDAGVVQLFRDDAFVGVAALPLVLPNDEMRMPFGVDDRVRIVVRDEREESGDRGIVNRQQLEQHKKRYEVTSFHNVEIPVEIVDRVPVPRDSDIKVEMIEGATPPTQKDVDGLQGVYLWRLAGTPRKTETIRHYYSVRFPRDRELAPVESN